MKRSFVPAGIFVLVLVLVAAAMKFYVKYEYQSAMDQFLRPDISYTVVDEKGGQSYPVTDSDSRVALAGYLQDTLALDKSVNGDPKAIPPESQSYGVQAEGGVTLMVSAEDPAICYIKGRVFTHYFTGGEHVAAYLAELTESLAA